MTIVIISPPWKNSLSRKAFECIKAVSGSLHELIRVAIKRVLLFVSENWPTNDEFVLMTL